MEENITMSDERVRQRKAEAAGEGAWFRKDNHVQVLVEVRFYPYVQLWITEAGERRKIGRQELEANYERIRL